MSYICHIHNYTEYNQQWNVFSAFNPSKSREHISQLVIICIIVYVTNKAHLSQIIIIIINTGNRKVACIALGEKKYYGSQWLPQRFGF